MKYPFKILQIEGNKATAKYVGIEQEFSRNNQSSEPKPPFLMSTGTQVEIDFEAVSNKQSVSELNRGDWVEMQGVFYDFTKQASPEMVFCATKIILAV